MFEKIKRHSYGVKGSKQEDILSYSYIHRKLMEMLSEIRKLRSKAA